MCHLTRFLLSCLQTERGEVVQLYRAAQGDLQCIEPLWPNAKVFLILLGSHWAATFVERPVPPQLAITRLSGGAGDRPFCSDHFCHQTTPAFING